MLRRRPRRPSVVIGCRDADAMSVFFAALGWTVERHPTIVRVATPGGSFGLTTDPAPPRLELALSLRDPLEVETAAELVEPAGGIVMEPLQGTGWGGYGCSFNDPEGNTWELGSPWTVTAVDVAMSTGARPPTDGPLVALAVPRRPSTTTVRSGSD